MLGPYFTKKDKTLGYRGNNIFGELDNVQAGTYTLEEAEKRVLSFSSEKYWGAIARINHQINMSSNLFFGEMKALFTLLPMTTRMISSPGAVYGREAISYTTDVCPISLEWFDLPNKAFLSESSQIYLELSVLQHQVDHVYSIYNSFRKENVDASHLSEFHHIEYEGAVNQAVNKDIITNFLFRVIQDLLKYNEADLSIFLSQERLIQLDEISRSKKITELTFEEALKTLHEDTKDDIYNKFTLENFGSWEEVRLTEIYGGFLAISEFPLLEVPFYHAELKGRERRVANNTDYIWPGYRETIGSGQRVGTLDQLREKAEVFNLPEDDYACYLQSRTLENYRETSGFGVGWERVIHGLLEMPYIWSAVQFPRTNVTLKP
ncbi:asparagine--tRNA ligase [Paenibacillus sp. CFBP13512]|uniref:amino acid--tRNA ligase-related protein n=1 Tax=Paenibacillus sp. CFBP13512 TaxID=2184007 RepID=UPI0010C0145B|nr:amino acid--tRNA ligase-related protein [Paenibacillus sp. CFBP13512]TKJ93364.1 asparagine--tRNA ligase [Paenibacillus sp. CFBP13512]